MARRLSEVGAGPSSAGGAPSSPASGPGAGAADRDLVVAFQRGDPSAFSEIYCRYHVRAERVCRSYLKNRDDAEEAAQEAMIRVFRGLSSFNGEYALRAWVDRIAANYCLDVLRARTRRPTVALAEGIVEEGGDQPADLSEVVESLIRRDEVHATLARLPAHHRAALVLRHLQGRSHAELAAVLGITGHQAKALIHRANRHFRRAWEGRGPWPTRLALLPIATAVKLIELLRRAAQPTKADSVAAASPTLVGSVGQTQHLTAAVVTLMVASSVGVGSKWMGEGPAAPSPPAPVRVAAEASPLLADPGQLAGAGADPSATSLAHLARTAGPDWAPTPAAEPRPASADPSLTVFPQASPQPVHLTASPRPPSAPVAVPAAPVAPDNPLGARAPEATAAVPLGAGAPGVTAPDASRSGGQLGELPAAPTFGSQPATLPVGAPAPAGQRPEDGPGDTSGPTPGGAPAIVAGVVAMDEELVAPQG